jgi:tetratricopeptide (TPR) repeat protein
VARRVPLALVAACLLLARAASGQSDSSSVLVQYSFDDDAVETGPDTFAVFQHAKGFVRLSSSNRYSGYRSIEIHDVAGDADFPELQGYFPVRARGKLVLHFALTAIDPFEELNIALAGPDGFRLRRNGIGFWLRTLDGYLCHYSDSMPKKLVRMQPFAWYVIDAVYDIDRGTYDLTVHEPGKSQPLVVLQRQPNAANQPGSAVDKFSFIGDTGSDQSNVDYYVDDVVVSVEGSTPPVRFAAPGRKKLFVDYWNDHQRSLRSRPGPLPATSLSDFGIFPSDFQSLRVAGLWGVLQRTLEGHPGPVPDSAVADHRRFLEAAVLWFEGNRALNSGKADVAFDRFEAAFRLVPAGKIYELNAVLSLAALGRWEQVDARLARIIGEWRDDMRLPAAMAMIGIARQDLAQAEQWLQEPAEQAGDQVGQILIAEQYFYVLLWQKQTKAAERFAERMVDRYRMLGTDPSMWIEKLGDAAFMQEDFANALRRYTESGGTNQTRVPPRILQKMSDVFFRLGDFENERLYREKVYGRLDTGY